MTTRDTRITRRDAARGVPLAALTAGVLDAPADIRVTDVTLDSRAVRPGALFLACRGATRHGLAFAEQAVAAGARAILYEPESAAEALPAAVAAVGSATTAASADAAGSAAAGASAAAALPAASRPGTVFLAPVPHLAQHAGTIADRFFDTPSQFLTVAGVTGTNGKTTSAYLLAQALTLAGRKGGYIGTLGCGVPGAIEPFGLTTADAVTVHRQLAQLRALGAECVGMEVSSHALAQGRVNGVRFRVAAFTNLTRDHLDFHGSIEAYGAAKARLFERELAARVLNIDDAFGLELARRFEGAAGRLVLTSRRLAGADARRAIRGAELVCARDVRHTPTGSTLQIDSSWGQARLATPLLGDFNVENILTVAGVLLSEEVPLDRVVAALGECVAPPGRMEIVRGPEGGALAIVDYAHTPDALAKALHAARAHCTGTLRVVFGCGGDRDPGKRPMMGRTARELADEVILTDDNPRTEDPARIIAGVLAGMDPGLAGASSELAGTSFGLGAGTESGGLARAQSGGRPVAGSAAVQVEHDRAAAIRGALERSSAGDVVLIAGKGHEDYQIVGGERRAFSDRAVARAFFSRRKGRA